MEILHVKFNYMYNIYPVKVLAPINASLPFLSKYITENIIERSSAILPAKGNYKLLFS